MPSLRIEIRPDRVAVVVLDTPGSQVNLLNRQLLAELGPMLEMVLGDPGIDACVLSSAKPSGFLAGADLKEILDITEASEAEALARNGREALERLEKSPKPFVAAIHGAALGGGLEVALACRARVASDEPKTVLGLPEVQLGLLPGAGGTQRLPRLVGLSAALPMLLSGQKLRPRKALRIGLVDRVVSRERLVDEAAALALQLAQGRLELKRPSGRGLESYLLKGARLPGLGGLIFRKARAEVNRKTRGNYPAPTAILECVQTGLRAGQAQGSLVESRQFGNLVASAEAKNLVWLFNATHELKKPAPGDSARKVRRLLVLGAGLMGEGIVSVSLPLMPVAVKDPGQPALEGLKARLKTSLDKRVKIGAMLPERRELQWSRLRAVKELGELTRAEAQETDLVIEAVFENLELKREVLAGCEALIEPTAVFASNTSALPIADIAAQARHPERVLGMHYFSPVPKMPLLEIVVTPKTADWALAAARGVGIAQGKSVIVVKDSPGFYTTRILMPFLAEAVLCLEEGAAIEEIDQALRDFGFPVGPLRLIDEVGIDVGAHVSRDLSASFAQRGMQGSDLLLRLQQAGFAGKKNRKGFYLYPAETVTKKPGPRRANPEIAVFLKRADKPKPSVAEITDRIAWIMVNEAMHCLNEGVISSARDGDVGAVLGLGFPPFRGGPFHFVDAYGPREAVARLHELSQQHGPRFRPAWLLKEHSREGRRFYPPTVRAGQS